MRLRSLGFIVMFSVLATVGTDALARFEPLFRVVTITGDCSIQRPGEREFIPAEESKAYPFGTAIQTGMRSSLVIVLSEGNHCRVLSNANLVMDEGTTDKKLKIIRLNEGEVEVELKEDFHADGNSLNVETATAICGAIGCKFRVASKKEADLRIIIVRVLEGLIRLHGENFSAEQLDKDDWVSLLSPPDREFIRIKTMKGEFDVSVKDEDLQEKIIPTEEGSVLKIWQRKVPGTDQHIVVIEIFSPDGTLLYTVTTSYEGSSDPKELGGKAPKPGEEPEPTKGGNPDLPPATDPNDDPTVNDDPDPDPGQDDSVPNERPRVPTITPPIVYDHDDDPTPTGNR
jgi:hypothetical protein